MKKILALLVLSAATAFAQSITPPEDVNDGVHIDLSAAFSVVNATPDVNGSDTVRANVLTARVPFTDRWAIRYQMINLAATNAQINLGEVEYRRSVGDVLKSSALRFDPNKYAVFGYGGFGGKRQDNSQTAAFSFIVGGGLDYNLSNSIALRLVDIAYLRSDLHQKGLLLSNHFQFAPGISLRF
jgi:opacity protein-like surface antigen